MPGKYRYNVIMISRQYKFTPLVLSALLCAVSLCAYAPYMEERRPAKEERVAFLISANRPVSYVISGTAKQENRPDVEKAFSSWRENALARVKKIQGYQTIFSDILPVLNSPVKLKPIVQQEDKKATAKIKFTFAHDKEDKCYACSTGNTIGCFKQYSDGTGGVFIYSPDATVWSSLNAAAGGATPQVALLHEVGHVLGLGDLYESARSGSDFSHRGASGLKKSIMDRKNTFNFTRWELTCDDADAYLFVLYEAMYGTFNKTYPSLCQDGSGYVKGVYVKDYEKTLSQNRAAQVSKSLSKTKNDYYQNYKLGNRQ